MFLVLDFKFSHGTDNLLRKSSAAKLSICGSYFLELKNHFFGLKYTNSLMRIRDGVSSDPGSGMGKSRIRDKHPGSATLDLCLEIQDVINVADPGCLSSRIRIFLPDP